ncbi:MAG: dTDP-4-dehydrorhamnose reductase [Armatimonadetes bacterium]|nr:dTDP-4-dehydrorhamnose reductase [Armatimonadota bacterium]
MEGVSKLKVLVTGASGQLGSDLVDELLMRSHDVVALSRSQLDITNCGAVAAAIREHRPSVFINCAAMVNVDACELDVEAAIKVNALAVWHIAVLCSKAKVKLVQISTDYVFDGEKNSPYTEADVPNPINVYGLTKFFGEMFVRNYCDEHLIVRTAGLYGIRGSRSKGGNFVEFVIGAALKNEPLRLVTDMVTSPTFTRDLASKLCELVEAEAHGIVHVVNSGQCSWHEFGSRALSLMGLDVQVIPIVSDELDRPARRPKYTPLVSIRLDDFGVEPLRDWREALHDYLCIRGLLKQ